MEEVQLALDLFDREHLPNDGTPVRRERREEVVRVVEYTPFPRQTPDQQPRLGFTRDLSASGMCLGVDAPEAPGSLLRVTVRASDGRPMRESVERVVWCRPERDGRFWLGLELLTEAQPSRYALD
jgi:hypothetical protein